jgi:hypothetical protein
MSDFSDKHRDLLCVLAGCPTGITEDALKHMGFSMETILPLVWAGYVTHLRQTHSNPPGLVVDRYWISREGKIQVDQVRRLQ